MRRLLLAFALFSGSAAMALPMPESFSPGETVMCEGAVDGDTIQLAGGKTLRLAGLLAPKDDEPLADAAKKTLDKLVRGKRLILAEEAPPDRYGRRRAQAAIQGSETWLQGEMLLRGLARVYTQPDAARGAENLFPLERAAREQRLGLWADKRYQIRDALQFIPAGRFEIVEGTVLATGRGTGKTYVNFGTDWKTDFTITIDSEAGKLLRLAKLSAKKLEGQKVRVRGYVTLTNGPMIALSHPEQLELLDPPPEKGHKSASLSRSQKPPLGEEDP
jgi:endonuclease YncB( thermonuclease family)